MADWNPTGIGDDAIADMAKFEISEAPVIFDVGANLGQSITKFKKQFPNSLIHSFEPSPATFEELRRHAASFENVELWNCALGSQTKSQTFLENSYPDMSSFLKPSEFGAGEITRETPVDVKTVDQICREKEIGRIDILKSDTQGYDFEVFKGAEKMIREGRIGLIFYEVIFSDMYKDLPSFPVVFEWLLEREFLLVSLYKFYYQRQLASWTDALFVHRSLLKETV